ncbi:ABC transporter substrate-binding protein [Photobacterium sp. WH77]|uniref:ABC transporter substrate-binding protein n=1 Tax=unclassified Photobacterium TaxID=2628852 RepID=UPI001EDAE488|nr:MULTISPECIES: ABC transporter substrate-binding protein [unclassified Photobacterium]MCG2839050.1 ABC transporter substrate-binding protein [Photobacterium sp. WH77]MCG2846667.1 ABC transporter substrate-binding protein [Photobacterium sp. WH80]MDO6582520.1 ABC transporter substrate-binding protein [Photobacterium sp. 2_MG-2023]
MKFFFFISLLVLTVSGAQSQAKAQASPGTTYQEVEFLHWWTAKGEVAAFNLATKALQDAGVSILDLPVQGGGGDTAMSILQARAIAGTPPDIVQLEGPSIKSWAALGFLHKLDQVAVEQDWHKNLLPIAQDTNQYQGHYVAIPITVHRLNWMWINRKVLRQYGLAVPTSWDALIDVFSRLKQNGVEPLALGKDQWQVALLFENLAFGYGGADYYRRAFIKMEPQALNSQTTYDILERFRAISQLVKPGMSHMRWDEGTQLLIEGERAFQISGDWVLGDLLANNIAVPSAIGCYPTPAKQTGFIYNMDSFALFDSPRTNTDTAQIVSKTLSSPDFQKSFNALKGAIPARNDISLKGYNSCSVNAKADMEKASKSGQLIPSIVDSMAVSPIAQRATSSEIFRFFNDETMAPEDFILHLQNIPRGE